MPKIISTEMWPFIFFICIWIDMPTINVSAFQKRRHSWSTAETYVMWYSSDRPESFDNEIILQREPWHLGPGAD